MADDDYYPGSSSSDVNDYDDDDDDDQYQYIGSDNDSGDESREGSTATVIRRDTLMMAQLEDLQTVMDLLALSEHHARTLLIYYRWNVERVSEMLDRKGRDELFSDAGVSIVGNKRDIWAYSTNHIVTCDVCFDNFSHDMVSLMDCGHYFCNDCWTEHFIVRINEGQSRRILCMAFECNTICDEAIIRNLVRKKHPDIAERFERFLLESYVDDNDKVQWCPSTPHCGNAIRVQGDLHCEVECACGLQFCFSCLSEAHSPCLCLMWDLWTKKCNAESENINWVVVNTKPCPKCHKSVEKNGGCNLVVCVCGQTFCWVCGGVTGRIHTWTNIAGHSCNRFKDEQQSHAELAKKNMYRFVHYHNRYKAHADSLNQESTLESTFEEKITVLENRDSDFKDFSWALSGMKMLFRSRRVLLYTYPFAFYMFGGELFEDLLSKGEMEIMQNLFEDQQEQLERNVEKLSMLLEKDFQPLTEEEISDIRMRVLALSKIVDFRCRQMYECIGNELLESLGSATHQIAPYKSKGVERALELSS